MKMSRFRVRNYKKINDTNWIECGDISAFVGKNEAGKSALFRGLSKINPSDKEQYDGLKEFPRHRFTKFNPDLPVCSVEFKLDDKDVKELSKICSMLEQTSKVIVTRLYSNDYTIKFDLEYDTLYVTTKTYLNALKRWEKEINHIQAPQGQDEGLNQMKTTINEFLTPTIQDLETKSPLDIVDINIIQNFSDYMPSNINEEWSQLFKKIIDRNNKFLNDAHIIDEINLAEDWVLENMPQYIYFDRYDIIDSAIHIEKFISDLDNNPLERRLRVSKCLFQHVGLDLEKIRDLGLHGEEDITSLRRAADERNVLMSSASAEMTAKFAEWWEQRKHKFRYQIDGQMFRVWVSDDFDPSEIELDQRSAGMQYFFSFYLIFLTEASGAHKNSILLLDEPGLHYHGTAQKKLVGFLQNISKDNSSYTPPIHLL